MIYIVLSIIIVVVFIFSWKLIRKFVATYWLGRGWTLIQEGNYKGAIKAFNEVNKLYKAKDLNPHTLSSKVLTEYIQFVGSSHVGLSIACASIGNFDLAKDKLALAKTLEIIYGANNPIEFMKKMGYDQFIELIKKIESHSYTWDK